MDIRTLSEKQASEQFMILLNSMYDEQSEWSSEMGLLDAYATWLKTARWAEENRDLDNQLFNMFANSANRWHILFEELEATHKANGLVGEIRGE